MPEHKDDFGDKPEYTDDIFEKIHEALCVEVLHRVKTGSATASDLEIARKILKDNFVTQPSPQEGDPLADLVDQMPFDDEEDAPSYPN